MKKPNKQWEIDAEWGSDIIGVGSHQLIREDIKKVKKPRQIGFIRQKVKQQPSQGKSKKFDR